MDTPALNRLIDGYESEAELLDFAIEMAISDWNSTSPILRPYLGIATFPSLYLLLHGAAIQVMKSQGLYQSRNELQYNAGGTSLVRQNKARIYMEWLANFSAEYEQKKRTMKIQMNVGRGWGGVHSEYAFLGMGW
jgi:hypothetical protein